MVNRAEEGVSKTRREKAVEALTELTDGPSEMLGLMI